jgi:hypothetical protein
MEILDVFLEVEQEVEEDLVLVLEVPVLEVLDLLIHHCFKVEEQVEMVAQHLKMVVYLVEVELEVIQVLYLLDQHLLEMVQMVE